MQPPTEDDYNTGCDTSTLCGTTDDNAGKENGQEPFTEVDAKEINGEVGRDALTDDGSTTSIEFCLDQDQCSRQSDIEEAE
jgi:hypothetical protein